MQPEVARTAFTLTALHQRRDGRRITAIGLYHDGQRVLLGFDNGHLEEHALLRGVAPAAPATAAAAALAAAGVPFASNASLRLLAERRVFKQAVAAIAPLQAAQRVALMGADGSVVLCAADSMQLVQLPQARNAVAIAAAAGAVAGAGAAGRAAAERVAQRLGGEGAVARLPSRLAVAVKAGKGKSKVLMYDVLPLSSTGSMSGQPALLAMQVPLPESVLQIAWAGRALLVAVPNGYRVLHGSNVITLAEQVPCTPLLGSLPAQGLGLLLWDEGLALVTDANGAAVREPLLLPGRPLALAQAGLFIIAVCDDGVHVFDRGSSREVQRIDWAHDDAYVNLSRSLPAADDAVSGRCVVLATSSAVLLLEPIALEQQVRELLKRKRFDEALELLDVCRASPDNAAWVDAAAAQAGLLLLLDAAFERAVEVLGRVPLSTFQPSELFALFPQYAARWLPRVPRNAYWGLHGSLPDLDTLVADHLELQAATSIHQGRGRQAPQQHQRQQQQQWQQQGVAGHERLEWQQQRQQAGSAGVTEHATALAAASDAAAELVLLAKRCMVDYLTTARQKQGIELPDGVDTLLVKLLCDCGEAGKLEALVSGRHAAVALQAAAAMAAVGRWHACARLHAALGHSEEALDIWQGMSQGRLQEAPCSNGEVAAAAAAALAATPASVPSAEATARAAAAVAVNAAARELAHEEKVSEALAMQYLPWLLQQDAAASLELLRARQLPAVEVGLLKDRSDDLRWQYLQHLVHERGSSNALLHTELALELAVAALAAAAGMAAAAWEAVGTALPVVFAPNGSIADASPGISGRTVSAVSSLLRAPGHSRHPSMAVGVPPSSYFAASRQLHGQPPGLGALAGAPVAQRRVTGLGAGHSHAPSRTLSGIAALLQQQQQQQQPGRTISFVPGAADGASGLSLVDEAGGGPGLRVLPGLWPSVVEVLESAGASDDAANSSLQQAPNSSGNSAGAPSVRAGGSVPPASAPAPDDQQHHQQQQRQRHGRVLLLRCTLAYHLQASLLYDAQAVLQALRQASTSNNSNSAGTSSTASAGTSSTASASTSTTGTPSTAARGLQLQGEGAGATSRSPSDTKPAHSEAVSGEAPSAAAHRIQRTSAAHEAAAGHLSLWPEQALVLSRLGDHAGALRLWALRCEQVEGAICYARALASQEAWLALLEMFLQPGEGLSPNYTAACRVLNAEGAALNPLKLLQSLSDDMPLALAHDTLARVLAGILHRRRYGQVVRALHRSQNLGARAERGELQAARVVVTDESTCRGCQRLLGSKIFFRYPSGVVLCSRCAGAGAPQPSSMTGD